MNERGVVRFAKFCVHRFRLVYYRVKQQCSLKKKNQSKMRTQTVLRFCSQITVLFIVVTAFRLGRDVTLANSFRNALSESGACFSSRVCVCLWFRVRHFAVNYNRSSFRFSQAEASNCNLRRNARLRLLYTCTNKNLA